MEIRGPQVGRGDSQSSSLASMETNNLRISKVISICVATSDLY